MPLDSVDAVADDKAADRLAILEDKDEADAATPLEAACEAVADAAVPLDPAGSAAEADDMAAERLAISEEMDEADAAATPLDATVEAVASGAVLVDTADGAVAAEVPETTTKGPVATVDATTPEAVETMLESCDDAGVCADDCAIVKLGLASKEVVAPAAVVDTCLA